MIKRNFFFWLFILATLVGLLRLPTQQVNTLKGSTVSWMAPVWEAFIHGKSFLTSLFSPSLFLSATKEEEIQRLKLERQLLNNQIEWLKELLQQSKDSYLPISSLGDLNLRTVPARIIYRSPGKWNHFFWINIGSADNPSSGPPVIALNSPVLSGTAVVGVLEYIGVHQSRVRLMTDPSLAISVRSVRGVPQNKLLSEHVEAVRDALLSRQELTSPEEKDALCEGLYRLKNQLSKASNTYFLAKGEMNGIAKPMGRGSFPYLKGIGFNYDFSDEQGPARDLRTGKAKDREGKGSTLPILKFNDLLLTTGMDGIFPPGLRVGVVSYIKPLKEGDFYYEIEAKPCAGNLDDLSLVFVIPPSGYEGN